MARQSSFGTWTSLPFCASSWVPSSEGRSVLSVSVLVELAGCRCLPAGCNPPCRIISGCPSDSKVRDAQCLRRTGKVCGLIIWSADEGEAILNHPFFYLHPSAVAISIYSQLGEWPLKSPVMSRLWLTSGRVCSCRSLSGEH